MSNGLHEVIGAASQSGNHGPAAAVPVRSKPVLRAVETSPPARGPRDVAPAPTGKKDRSTSRRRGSASPTAGDTNSTVTLPLSTETPISAQLGAGGFRLAFWLCGFYNALKDRQRSGELLSDRETMLLAASGKDFAELRPIITEMTLGRLDAIFNAPTVVAITRCDRDGPGAMDLFALSTLRNLSLRARDLLAAEGPDAALALFGDAAKMQEPLAIFEVVFAAALDLVEAFESTAPKGSHLLGHVADLLDSEVERI